MKSILPNVYTFDGLRVGRVYLITAPEGLVLVDAGMASAAGPILRQLAAAGHKPADVRWIVITHAHPDHVGGLPELRRVTGAAVVASDLEARVIEGRTAIPRPDPSRMKGPLRLRPPEMRLAPTPVDILVDEGDELPVLGGLEVIETPGHAPGHLAFRLRRDNLLFVGDLLFNIPHLGLPWNFLTCDMDENIRSINKAAGLKPDVLCFGHGQPLFQAAGRLEAFTHQLALSHIL